MKLFPSLEWVVPRHFCKREDGQAGDGILQPPPPCWSACSLQKEDAGGSPGPMSVNPLIWEQIPIEVALPCLLLVHNLLDEAFAETAVRMLHGETVALPMEVEAVRWCCHPPGRQLQPFRAKFPLHSPRGLGFFFTAPSPHPSGFLFKGIPGPA